MPLLERYLYAVGRHLPPAKEADILAELRDDIQASLDERTAELGHALTPADEAAVLKRYGRPVLMASRYAPQRHLIGPDWLPYYWPTLKVALAVALIAHVAALVLLAIMGKPTGPMVDRLFAFPTGTAVTVFAVVTLVFAVLERAASQAWLEQKWNPMALPRAAAGVPTPSRFDVAIELVVYAVFVTWWTAVHRSTGLLHMPPLLDLAPAWPGFYLPVLLVVLASMAVKSVVLVRPDLSVFRLAAGLLVTAAGIAVAGLVLSAGPLILPGQPGHEAERLAEVVNAVLRWSVGIAVVISLVTTAFDIWRWVRGRQRAG
jgi:hypothetical protein